MATTPLIHLMHSRKGPFLNAGTVLPTSDTLDTMRPSCRTSAPCSRGLPGTSCPRNVGLKRSKGSVTSCHSSGGAQKSYWYCSPSNWSSRCRQR